MTSTPTKVASPHVATGQSRREALTKFGRYAVAPSLMILLEPRDSAAAGKGKALGRGKGRGLGKGWQTHY